MVTRCDHEDVWFPNPERRYVRARVAHVSGRHCVLCRREATVFVDVLRGTHWWHEAMPLCGGCAGYLAEAIVAAGVSARLSPSGPRSRGRPRRSTPSEPSL